MPSIEGWLRPSVDLVRGYIRSELQHFPCHFVELTGKTARCSGSKCQICDHYPRWEHELVVLSAGELRALKLLELKPRHMDVIELLMELGPEAIGMPLFIWRDATEHGEPTIVSSDRPAFARRSMQTDRLALKPVPCERYCARIGTREHDEALIALGYADRESPASLQLAV